MTAQFADKRQQLGLRAIAERAKNFKFDRAPEEMHFERRCDIDTAHDGGVLREYIDQPLFGQAHECIPDRRLAQAEMFGEFAPNKHGAWRKIECDDQRPYRIKHLRGALAVAIQSQGRDFVYDTHRSDLGTVCRILS